MYKYIYIYTLVCSIHDVVLYATCMLSYYAHFTFYNVGYALMHSILYLLKHIHCVAYAVGFHTQYQNVCMHVHIEPDSTYDMHVHMIDCGFALSYTIICYNQSCISLCCTPEHGSIPRPELLQADILNPI